MFLYLYIMRERGRLANELLGRIRRPPPPIKLLRLSCSSNNVQGKHAGILRE